MYSPNSPMGALRKISTVRYSDLSTVVARLADSDSETGDLSAHQVRLQCEGFIPVSDALLERVADDLDATDSVEWLRGLFSETATTSHDLTSLENLRELAIAGATFRRTQ